MKKEDIQVLLNKYFEGESSLLEEKQLHHYFLFEEVAAEFENYRILFTAFEEDKKIISPLNEESLDFQPKSFRLSWTSSMSWAAAALILIFLSISWFFKPAPNEVNSLSHEEILIAQKYLNMGFDQMDKGYLKTRQLVHKTAIIETQTREVEKMSTLYQKNLEKLKHINQIDQSLEKLQNISSIQKSKVKLVM
mgnify:CR=1 FL=1